MSTVQQPSVTSRRPLGLALAALTALFLVLGVGALGILGPGGRPDRVYVVVLAVLLVGAAVSRLRPSGLAQALAATAAAQVLVTAVALLGGLPPEGSSTLDIVGVNLMYTALWAVSAWLVHPVRRR
ncbi:hypothetical protein [Nocardioides lijunqiniae]|uniref:hypothetical protein n=1 Tax=Nocardioides lijunqiniae TaxID=2760832 RepID=UPI001877D394|nr:hypothetical protein [Nocardioides lijunqiniae]